MNCFYFSLGTFGKQGGVYLNRVCLNCRVSVSIGPLLFPLPRLNVPRWWQGHGMGGTLFHSFVFLEFWKCAFVQNGESNWGHLEACGDCISDFTGSQDSFSFLEWFSSQSCSFRKLPDNVRPPPPPGQTWGFGSRKPEPVTSDSLLVNHASRTPENVQKQWIQETNL